MYREPRRWPPAQSDRSSTEPGSKSSKTDRLVRILQGRPAEDARLWCLEENHSERELLEFLATFSSDHAHELNRLNSQQDASQHAREQALWEHKVLGLPLPLTEWNEADHPRTGTAPNAGWFASKGGGGASDGTSGRGEPSKGANATAATQDENAGSYAAMHGGIQRVYQVRSMWDHYDSDVAAGIIKPTLGQKLSAGLGKMLLPRSDPTTVIEYGDGTKDVVLGGGPSIGAMADQLGAIQGIRGATKVAAGAAAGRLITGGTKGALTGAVDELNAVERKFADELVARGKNVHAVPRGSQKTPDFLVDGAPTELKSPTSAGPTTIKNAIQRAVKQGKNIVVNVRGLPVTPQEAATQIMRAEGNVGNLKGRVTVLTSEGTITY